MLKLVFPHALVNPEEDIEAERHLDEEGEEEKKRKKEKKKSIYKVLYDPEKDHGTVVIHIEKAVKGEVTYSILSTLFYFTLFIYYQFRSI